MSADPKEEEYIHNPIDELWKLTDNQQLSLDQMSCSLKSHKKLDGAHEEKKKQLTLVAQFSKISCTSSSLIPVVLVSGDMGIKHTAFYY